MFNVFCIIWVMCRHYPRCFFVVRLGFNWSRVAITSESEGEERSRQTKPNHVHLQVSCECKQCKITCFRLTSLETLAVPEVYFQWGTLWVTEAFKNYITVVTVTSFKMPRVWTDICLALYTITLLEWVETSCIGVYAANKQNEFY